MNVRWIDGRSDPRLDGLKPGKTASTRQASRWHLTRRIISISVVLGARRRPSVPERAGGAARDLRRDQFRGGKLRTDPALVLDIKDRGKATNAHPGMGAQVRIERYGDRVCS